MAWPRKKCASCVAFSSGDEAGSAPASETVGPVGLGRTSKRRPMPLHLAKFGVVLILLAIGVIMVVLTAQALCQLPRELRLPTLGVKMLWIDNSEREARPAWSSG
jgi:hypothetical protein